MNKTIQNIDNRAQSFLDHVVELSKEFISQTAGVKNELLHKGPENVDHAKEAVIAGATAAAAFIRRRRSVLGPLAVAAAAVGAGVLIYNKREQIKAAARKAKKNATPALHKAQETLHARLQNLQSSVEQLKQHAPSPSASQTSH